MAKKITISELVIKVGADVKEATKSLKQIDRLSQQVGKKQTKQKQKEERTEKENSKEAASRLRHQERMQLAAHRAKLKQEDILLREKLKNGERIRRQELANHRKAVREQQQREKAARNQNKPKRRGNGGGIGAGGVAAGVAAGTAFNASISGAINGLINTMTDLFNMAKDNTMAREQIKSNLYASYRKKGLTPEEANKSVITDDKNIQAVANEKGLGSAEVGKVYSALIEQGKSQEFAAKYTRKYFEELIAAGATEPARHAFIRETMPIIQGTGASAEAYNTVEEWGLTGPFAALLGKDKKEISKLAVEGDLNSFSQKVNPEAQLKNMDKFGTGKYVKEAPNLNPVTKASQELDAAIGKLKDVFSEHASGGIARALNDLADVLAKKETQQAIVSAGESFGVIIQKLSGILVEFVDSGALQSFVDTISPENIQKIADGFNSFIDVMGRLVDWLDWILPDSEKPKPKPEASKPAPFKAPYSYRTVSPEELKRLEAEHYKSQEAIKKKPVKGKGFDFDAYMANLEKKRKELQQNTFDTVMDTMLPPVSGAEQLQENIKASSELSSVPAMLAAPSTTTNSSSVINNNNVSVNTTVNGDVGTDKAVTTIKEAASQVPTVFSMS